jgi:iterative type I PKS product template protein
MVYSLGEFAAFVIAGAISLEDGLQLVARRAQLMVESCSANTTGMLTCNLGHRRVESLIMEREASFSSLTVSCQNSNQDSVVSGTLPQLQAFREFCEASGHKSKFLDVPYGFHSPAMDPIIPALRELSSSVRFYTPRYPLGSTAYGRLVSFEDINGDYFVEQTRGTVLFSDLMQSIERQVDLESAVFLEIGPSALTLPLIRRNISNKDHEYLPSLNRNEGPWQTLSTSLLKIDQSHCKVDWRGVFSGTQAKIIDLPRYPLEKSEHFIPFRESSKGTPMVGSSRTDLLSTTLLRRQVQHRENGSVFESDLETLSPYIKGHVVGGVPLCPASVYYTMAVEGQHVRGRGSSHDSCVVICEVVFQNPLVYVANSERVVRFELIETDTAFICSSAPHATSEQRTTHATGQIAHVATSVLKKSFLRKAVMVSRQIALLESSGCRLNTFHTKMIYEKIFPRVVVYAGNYQSIRHIKVTENGLEGFGVFQLPKRANPPDKSLSPAFTDSIIHAAGFIANSHVNILDAYICAKVERIDILQDDVDQDATFSIYCSLLDGVENSLLADAYAIDSSGAVVAAVEGMHFKKVQLRAFQAHLSRQQALAAVPAISSSDEDSASSTISDSDTSTNVSTPAELGDIPTTGLSDAAVARIVLRVTGADQSSFSSNSRLAELGVDSMLTIELCEELRKAFRSFTADLSALGPMSTIRDLQDHVASTIPGLRKSPTTTTATLPSMDTAAWSSRDVNAQPHKKKDDSGKVKNIIGRICGIPAIDIQQSSRLCTLGVDSLLAIELKDALSHELPDRNIPQLDLEGDLTVGDLISILCSNQQVPEHSSMARPTTQSGPKAKVAVPVLFQEGVAESIPIFFFHDGSGSADMYARLPNLGCSIFGIANPGFSDSTHWADSLKDMAVHYASAVEARGYDQVIVGGK